MEIRYKRTYHPSRGKRYTAGEAPVMLGYAVEAADPRAAMKEGKLAPGEICMMLFGITPEEYAWKDSAPKQLDALVDQLIKHVPADRLIGWRICDLKGTPVQKKLEPVKGASIDEGAFAVRVQEKMRAFAKGPVDDLLLECRLNQKLCAGKDASEEAKQKWRSAKETLGKALLGLEKIYVMDEALMDGKWPAIGFDGRLELFTTEERACKAMEQVTAANAGVQIWKLREIEGGKIEQTLRQFAADGLEALRVDNGFAAADLHTKDFMDLQACENAAIRGLAIREIEFGQRWTKLKEVSAPEQNLRGALESMLSFRNFAWREIGNSTLYSICMNGMRDKRLLLGGKDSGEKLIAVFTDKIRAAAFAERLEGNAVPVGMKFDELIAVPQASGLLIDVGNLNYRLPACEFDKVKDIRTKPPMLVRLRVPEEGKSAEVKPAAEKVVPKVSAELPNPDDYAPAAKTQAPVKEEETPENTQNPAEKAPKKGFFKKLFGK